MSKLDKPPSLQHLALFYNNDPQVIKKSLLTLAKNKPTFTYAPLYNCIRDMMLFGQSYEAIRKAIGQMARKDVAAKYLEILPFAYQHFSNIKPQFVQAVAPRFYPVGKNLLVPFSPPFIYNTKGTLTLPWLSFWKSLKLSGENLGLFVSVIEDIQSQDPDLEEARFQIVEFTANNKVRELNIIEYDDMPKISAERRVTMLNTFAEGFFLAVEELANQPQPEQNKEDKPQQSDDTQPGLFDI
jgi:hypothetical protein